MKENNINFSITPETKIGALLNHYPQLEEVLIEMAPAFKKLRNPILRKTVVKVATLRQVAQIGDISLATIINRLRAVVGHSDPDGLHLEGGDHLLMSEEHVDSSTPPPWFDKSLIVKSLDARPLLESGNQPITQVMEEIKTLNPGKIYELTTPFVPAPLIDMIQQKGYRVYSKQIATELVKTYFSIAE